MEEKDLICAENNNEMFRNDVCKNAFVEEMLESF